MDKKKLDRLMNLVALGNEEAFSELYYNTSKGIYAFIYPYFNDSSLTEDALQEIYMMVKDKAYMYKKGSDARAWLFQLAKNHSLNMLYKMKRENEKVDMLSSNIEDKHETKYDNTLFIIMQHTLTDEEYQIVIRHVLMGYKHREIARDLNIPLGSVTTKYKNALEKLRKELEEWVLKKDY